MNLWHRTGNEFPTPETVDVLAEVSEYRAGKTIGVSGHAAEASLFVAMQGNQYGGAREALVSLAAWAIARIELIDKGKI